MNTSLKVEEKTNTKTTTGKVISRMNAKKHGILGNIFSDYEQEYYEHYIHMMKEEFTPESPLEIILVERIAFHLVKLARLQKAETEFMRETLEPSIPYYEGISFCEKEGYKAIVNRKNIEYLASLYSRYETSIENRLYKAIKELVGYQSNKKTIDIK